MTILGIDTSGGVAGIALIKDDIIVGEYNIEYEKKHSTTLIPMLDQMMSLIGTELEEVDAIAVTEGPGSFTGIRIGAASAKGLAYALSKEMVPVPTLEALAFNYSASRDLICPIMDARRSQVYNGIYRFTDGKLEVIKDQRALPVIDVIEELNEMGERVIFLGDGVPVYRDIIEENIKVDLCFATPNLAHQKASSVASLGAIYYKEGKSVGADDFKPFYLRKSQAEQNKEKEG